MRSAVPAASLINTRFHFALAVVAPECVSRPTVWTAYSASEGVTQAVLALEEARQALSALQVGCRSARAVATWLVACLRAAALQM